MYRCQSFNLSEHARDLIGLPKPTGLARLNIGKTGMAVKIISILFSGSGSIDFSLMFMFGLQFFKNRDKFHLATVWIGENHPKFCFRTDPPPLLHKELQEASEMSAYWAYTSYSTPCIGRSHP
jgi:hypothetical protein